MPFNNHLPVALRRGFLILALLSLSACSMLGGKDTDAVKPADAEAQDADIAAEGEKAAPVLPPNPYYEKIPATNEAARQQFQRGVAAMRNSNWSAAKTEFTGLAENQPNLSGPFLNLGIIARQKGDLKLAKQHFSHAIEVNPANQEAYNQLALLYRKQGEFKQAEATFLQAIKVWPGYADIQLNLGILYELYMGEMESALEHYQNYQQLQSEPDKKVSGWIIDLQRRVASR